mgnify:CR=1 FL=1
MRTHTFFKVAVLSGLLALAGCSSKVAAPEQYSGFFKRLFWIAANNVRQTGKPTLRWVDPSYNEANYNDRMSKDAIPADLHFSPGMVRWNTDPGFPDLTKR